MQKVWDQWMSNRDPEEEAARSRWERPGFARGLTPDELRQLLAVGAFLPARTSAALVSFWPAACLCQRRPSGCERSDLTLGVATDAANLSGGTQEAVGPLSHLQGQTVIVASGAPASPGPGCIAR